MVKKIALLLAMCLCCAGCSKEGTEDSSSAVEVYVALPLPDLFVEIPEHFETTSSQYYEEYYVCEDASVIITEDPNGPYSSVEDYVTRALVKYQEIADEVILHHNEILYAGTSAVHTLEFTYSIPAEDGTSITKTCFAGFLTDTQSMYIITCKPDPDTYEKYRTDFVNIATSVSFVQNAQ